MVQLAEDAWNTRDPEIVVLAYSPDSHWRNRHELLTGHDSIRAFLYRKWRRELHYRLTKELWSFTDHRICVRFEYEWQDAESGRWFRTLGNELWQFNSDGLMTHREMSADDIPISSSERRIGIAQPEGKRS